MELKIYKKLFLSIVFHLIILASSLPLRRQKRATDVGPCRALDRRARKIDCSSLNLTAIPAQVLSQSRLIYLDLSNNDLKDLQGLESLTSLKELYLAGNVLDYISSDMLPCGTNPKLKNIYGMEVNNINESSPFHCLTGLKLLDLTLHAEIVQEELFEGLLLETLKLTLSVARQLPEKLFGNIASHVQNIHLSAPNLESLEHRFSPLMKLRKLYLDLPNVDVLPNDLLCGDGVNIAQQLNITQGFDPLKGMLEGLSQHCLVDELSIRNVNRIPTGFFRGSATLNIIRMRNITHLPSDMFHDVARLKELDLSHNNLSSIPPAWFDPLRDVENFNLSHNQLEHLNESIFNSKINIVSLDLSNNKLNYVGPKTFEPVKTSLKMLNLSNNYLPQLAQGLFSGMISLEHLIIKNNSIRSIPSDSFFGVSKLENLEMQHNDLERISNSDFHGLNDLIKIDLSYNQIEEIESEAFQHMQELVEINLEGNNLFRIPLNLFGENWNLQKLNMYNNSLHCDCNTFTVFEKIKFNYEGAAADMVCVTPDEYEGFHVSDLSDYDICRTTAVPPATTLSTTAESVSTEAALTTERSVSTTTDPPSTTLPTTAESVSTEAALTTERSVSTTDDEATTFDSVPLTTEADVSTLGDLSTLSDVVSTTTGTVSSTVNVPANLDLESMTTEADLSTLGDVVSTKETVSSTGDVYATSETVHQTTKADAADLSTLGEQRSTMEAVSSVSATLESVHLATESDVSTIGELISTTDAVSPNDGISTTLESVPLRKEALQRFTIGEQVSTTDALSTAEYISSKQKFAESDEERERKILNESTTSFPGEVISDSEVTMSKVPDTTLQMDVTTSKMNNYDDVTEKPDTATNATVTEKELTDSGGLSQNSTDFLSQTTSANSAVNNINLSMPPTGIPENETSHNSTDSPSAIENTGTSAIDYNQLNQNNSTDQGDLYTSATSHTPDDQNYETNNDEYTVKSSTTEGTQLQSTSPISTTDSHSYIGGDFNGASTQQYDRGYMTESLTSEDGVDNEWTTSYDNNTDKNVVVPGQGNDSVSTSSPKGLLKDTRAMSTPTALPSVDGTGITGSLTDASPQDSTTSAINPQNAGFSDFWTAEPTEFDKQSTTDLSINLTGSQDYNRTQTTSDQGLISCETNNSSFSNQANETKSNVTLLTGVGENIDSGDVTNSSVLDNDTYSSVTPGALRKNITDLFFDYVKKTTTEDNSENYVGIGKLKDKSEINKELNDNVQAVQLIPQSLSPLLWTIVAILILANVLLLIFFIKRLEGWVYKRSYTVNKNVHLY